MLPVIIAAWAAAIAGLIYIIKKVWGAARFGRRLTVAAGRLIDIAETDLWPNGAASLPEAMSEIYDRQGKTHELLESYIVAHRVDHGLSPPEGTPGGF